MMHALPSGVMAGVQTQEPTYSHQRAFLQVRGQWNDPIENDPKEWLSSPPTLQHTFPFPDQAAYDDIYVLRTMYACYALCACVAYYVWVLLGISSSCVFSTTFYFRYTIPKFSFRRAIWVRLSWNLHSPQSSKAIIYRTLKLYWPFQGQPFYFCAFLVEAYQTSHTNNKTCDKFVSNKLTRQYQ